MNSTRGVSIAVLIGLLSCVVFVVSFADDEVTADQRSLWYMAQRRGLQEMSVVLTITDPDGEAIPGCTGRVTLTRVGKNGGQRRESHLAECDRSGHLKMSYASAYGFSVEIAADGFYSETWQWYLPGEPKGMLFENGRDGVRGHMVATVVLDVEISPSRHVKSVEFLAAYGRENLVELVPLYYSARHQGFRRRRALRGGDYGQPVHAEDFMLLIECEDSIVGVVPKPRSQPGLPERRKGCKLVVVGGSEGDGFVDAGPFEEGLLLWRKWRRVVRAPIQGYVRALELNGTAADPAVVFYFRLNGVRGKGRVFGNILMPSEGHDVEDFYTVNGVYDSSGGVDVRAAMF